MLDTLLIMLDVIIVLPSFVLAHLGVLHVSPMYSLCTYFVCEWSQRVRELPYSYSPTVLQRAKTGQNSVFHIELLIHKVW